MLIMIDSSLTVTSEFAITALPVFKRGCSPDGNLIFIEGSTSVIQHDSSPSDEPPGDDRYTSPITTVECDNLTFLSSSVRQMPKSFQQPFVGYSPPV